MAAEEQHLIKVEASIGNLNLFDTDVREAISSDLFSALGQEWNKERNKIIDLVMGPLLFPAIVKGLKEKLSANATDFVINAATKQLEAEIDIAGWEIRGQIRRDSTPILAMSWGDGERGSPLVAVLLDVFGNFVDRVSFDRMHDMTENKKYDMDRMLEYLKLHSIELVVMSGTSPNTKTRLFEDVKRVVEEGRLNVEVQIMDDAVAKIYMDSKRGVKEFPDTECTALVRYCISLGRRALDPTMEFAGLFNAENEILLLHLHPLQKLVCVYWGSWIGSTGKV
jgi:transcriptional accessory protein Tex/SPT6